MGKIISIVFLFPVFLVAAENYVIGLSGADSFQRSKKHFLGLKVIKEIPQINTLHVRLNEKEKAHLLQELKPKFFYKERTIYLDEVPNDEKFSKQRFDMIHIPLAWDITKGSKDIIVAVIDTGSPVNHPDYQGQSWVNNKEIPDNNIDDDNNGYVDDYWGWSFARKSKETKDVHGHGAHVAGVIGAKTNNGQGVAGINWHTRIMNLACFSKKGTAKDPALSEAIIYAVDHGARIINASWGSGSRSPAIEEAIKYANEKNVLFVAAAGNSSVNADRKPHYPSSVSFSNVVSVGSISSRDRKSRFSNFGKTSVDFGAPGSFIYSLGRTKGYKSMSGTSMASPHVAGVAALVLAVEPSLNVVDLKNALLNAIDPVERFKNTFATGGILNAHKAVKQIFEGPQLWPLQYNLKIGDVHQMTDFGFRAISWEVSDPSVATIGSQGELLAQAAGEVRITARASNGKSYTSGVFKVFK